MATIGDAGAEAAPVHASGGDASPSASDVALMASKLAAAEAHAAELEEWFDFAFGRSPVAMGVISAAVNRYVRMNDAFLTFVGRTREEMSSVDPFTFSFMTTHPDDLMADQKLFGELAVGARSSYSLEKRYLRPDGSYRWGLLTVSGAYEKVASPGMPVGPLRYVALQIVDVHERHLVSEALARREEELRHAQRIDAIGRLAGGIAHDFNNLLTVIAGHGELLRDLLRGRAGGVRDADTDDEAGEPLDAVEAVDAMVAAAERAASLTAQLLAHGRRERVVLRTFNLSEQVAAMQRLLVRVIGSNIETDQALAAEGLIHADAGQVGQVVMNLVLNARDAMPEGGRLALSTTDVPARDGDDGWVELTVGDTGHGMTPEVQARAFEPFFTTRADRPGTQGTGLGLATVQRIVEAGRGVIEVHSAVGEGTRVTVRWPRVPDEPARAEPTMPARRMLDPARAERILVVEDEPQVRALVATVLVGAHFRVSVAKNGEEALQMIAADPVPFDLVITDLVMARIGGASLARRLHETGRLTRMLFISGYSDETPDELAPYGTLLPKPFTPSQLVATVRAVFESAEASDRQSRQ